jgi:hypothetical protein
MHAGALAIQAIDADRLYTMETTVASLLCFGPAWLSLLLRWMRMGESLLGPCSELLCSLQRGSALDFITLHLVFK